jgi:hypothetical protein
MSIFKCIPDERKNGFLMLGVDECHSLKEKILYITGMYVRVVYVYIEGWRRLIVMWQWCGLGEVVMLREHS